MYHPTSIAPLSQSQILKALKGHPVRISAGNQHDIELSADQFKKFAKAHQKGKASTITMDPYQIQNHMHILGSGVLKKSARRNAGRLITAGTDRAIRYLEGGNVIATSKDSAKRLITAGTDRAIRALDGSGFGGNIIATSKDSGKRLIVAGTDRAVRALDGSGVNRLKKAGRWEQFANATIRDGIDTAGKASRVYYDSSNPMAQMGFGLKKRGRPRRRMSAGALYPAGVY